MVNSCMQCESCKKGQEHHCETTGMVGTYGTPEPSSPTGITQGGYANNIVVTEHFAIKIPNNIDLQYAAPLLCAGITTYSPMMQYDVKSLPAVNLAERIKEILSIIWKDPSIRSHKGSICFKRLKSF